MDSLLHSPASIIESRDRSPANALLEPPDLTEPPVPVWPVDAMSSAIHLARVLLVAAEWGLIVITNRLFDDRSLLVLFKYTKVVNWIQSPVLKTLYFDWLHQELWPIMFVQLHRIKPYCLPGYFHQPWSH